MKTAELFRELKEREVSGAEFSEDRKYRYMLWRVWDKRKAKVMFIGLNPSTANEREDDPTIKRVCAIAKHNGFGGVYMLNCFAYISTDPSLLVHDSASEEFNNDTLITVAGLCWDVVFAWGNF